MVGAKQVLGRDVIGTVRRKRFSRWKKMNDKPKLNIILCKCSHLCGGLTRGGGGGIQHAYHSMGAHGRFEARLIIGKLSFKYRNDTIF